MNERQEALKELGRTAAERRESKGMTLEDVFDKTRIRMEYLKGIEAGNYKNFPEPVYIKGFIRTYLHLIDAEDLKDDFMNQIDRIYNPKKTHEQNVNRVLRNGSSFPEGFKPASHFWLFLVLIAALIGTGLYVWYAITYGGLDIRNLKLFSFSGTSVPEIPIEQNLLSGDIQEISGDEDSLISDDSASDDKEPEPQVKPSLEIRAINDVWLKVTIGNNVVFSRIMKRGNSSVWDLTAPATVIFGRPTAAQVILNGKDLGVPNPRAKRAETYIYQPDGTFSQRRSGRN